MVEPEAFFTGDKTTDPVERLDRAEAAVHRMTYQNEAQLRLMLANSLLAGPGAGAGSGGVLLSVGVAVVKIAVLVGFTLVVGKRVIPALLGYVAKTRSRELFTLTVLVLALGIAVGSAKLFGASMALGAFLAGMVVGQSDFSSRAASEALPMRDAFAVLFFVSAGMLFHPAYLWEAPALVAATHWAFSAWPLTRIFAVPFARNGASCRVLEKAGYVLEGRMHRSAIKQGEVLDQLLYAAYRSER